MTSSRLPPPNRASSTVDVRFAAQRGRTSLDRLHESGGLRLRRARGAACEAILVNIAGGIVGGDSLAVTIACGDRAEATVTSVAAEKIYRTQGPAARIATRLDLNKGASLAWIPQETILFDGARLERTLDVDLAADARLVAAEIVVFGRLASGESATHGALRDNWRVRRDSRLVFAEATRLDGAIGATLDRPAVGNSARVVALLLVAAPDAAAQVEPLRAAFATVPEVEAGVSARDGIAVARALARSPERLRAAMIAALGAVGLARLPRVWS